VDAFDYGQAAAAAPLVAMTHTTITKAERRFIAAHPPSENHPT
jgi:hypothetical protein